MPGGEAAAILRAAKDAQEAASLLAKLWHRGDLQLIGSQADVPAIKEIRGSPEAERLVGYTVDGQEARWVRMGIYMRQHASDQDHVHQLKRKLRRSGGDRAVAVAQVVQCQGLSMIIDWCHQEFAPAHARSEVRIFLENAHKDAIFVMASNDIDATARAAANRLQAANPSVFVLAGSGEAALTARMVHARLKNAHPMHEPRVVETPHEYIILFTRRPS